MMGNSGKTQLVEEGSPACVSWVICTREGSFLLSSTVDCTGQLGFPLPVSGRGAGLSSSFPFQCWCWVSGQGLVCVCISQLSPEFPIICNVVHPYGCARVMMMPSACYRLLVTFCSAGERLVGVSCLGQASRYSYPGQLCFCRASLAETPFPLLLRYLGLEFFWGPPQTHRTAIAVPYKNGTSRQSGTR